MTQKYFKPVVHLRIHHPEFYETAQKKREFESHQDEAISSQPTIEDMFQKQRKWRNSDDRSKQMDKLVIEMIVTGNQPFTSKDPVVRPANCVQFN